MLSGIRAELKEIDSSSVKYISRLFYACHNTDLDDLLGNGNRWLVTPQISKEFVWSNVTRNSQNYRNRKLSCDIIFTVYIEIVCIRPCVYDVTI